MEEGPGEGQGSGPRLRISLQALALVPSPSLLPSRHFPSLLSLFLDVPEDHDGATFVLGRLY